MDIDIPWEDDGTREFPHLRKWHFDRLKDELQKIMQFLKIGRKFNDTKQIMAVKIIEHYDNL